MINAAHWWQGYRRSINFDGPLDNMLFGSKAWKATIFKAQNRTGRKRSGNNRVAQRGGEEKTPEEIERWA